MKKIFWNSIIIINFYLILYFWFQNSGSYLTSGKPGDLYIALGRLTGLLSAYLILIQLILISRFSLIEREYGFDKLNNLHKWIGFSLGIFIISHPVLLSIGYSKASNTSAFAQFINFQTQWNDVLSGTIALIIILITALISMKKIRSLIPYEIWYFAHLPLYIAVIIAFGHQINTGDMVSGGALWYWFIINALTAGVLIIYRFLRPAYSFIHHSFEVEKIIKESDNVYSVYITGKNMAAYRFESGQFATLIFLQKGVWFHHPFSFSDIYNSKNLRFTIKMAGDFTNKIGNIHIGTKVWIDGPFGAFTLQKAVKSKKLFIAGGIGITPILSIIKSLPKNNDACLMYSNRFEKDIIFKNELLNSGIKTKYLETSRGEGNRINIEKISKLCPDYLDRDIYICGPVFMTNSLIKNLKTNGALSEQIHCEIFNY